MSPMSRAPAAPHPASSLPTDTIHHSNLDAGISVILNVFDVPRSLITSSFVFLISYSLLVLNCLEHIPDMLQTGPVTRP